MLQIGYENHLVMKSESKLKLAKIVKWGFPVLENICLWGQSIYPVWRKFLKVILIDVWLEKNLRLR